MTRKVAFIESARPPDDLSRVVDGGGTAALRPERDPEFGHLSVHIQKRLLTVSTGSINHRSTANDLPRIVDALRHTRSPSGISSATEGSQVGHLSTAVEEGVSGGVPHVRPANH